MLAGEGGHIVNISSLGALMAVDASRALLLFQGWSGDADPGSG